jgi:hypothetical protein
MKKIITSLMVLSIFMVQAQTTNPSTTKKKTPKHRAGLSPNEAEPSTKEIESKNGVVVFGGSNTAYKKPTQKKSGTDNRMSRKDPKRLEYLRKQEAAKKLEKK